MDSLMVMQALVVLGILVGLILLWKLFSYWADRHEEKMKHIRNRGLNHDNIHEPTFSLHHEESDDDDD